MDDQYRLQLFDIHGACLAINWASAYGADRYATGDCVVRAIRSTTDVAAHNRTRGQLQRYTDPMTISDVRRFIDEHRMMLGSQVHDCVGIVLEDSEDRIVPFDQPITVRS